MAEKNEGVYFIKLEIEGFRCFGPKQTLDLSDGNENWRRWTVILGDNGTGKTTLLQLLAAFEHEKFNSDVTNNDYSPVGADPFHFTTPFRAGMRAGMAAVQISVKNKENFSQQLHFDHSGIGFDYIGFTQLDHLKCYGYGANRFMSFNKLSDSKKRNSQSLFNEDAKLINAEEWLLQLDYAAAATKDASTKNYAIQKREQVIDVLLNLLPDITEIRFSEPTKENLKTSVEFKTPYGWVTIHQLSLGYKTMVAWMVDLAARLFERYPDKDNPLAEPAIVLIDEIDLHLHPKWQRKIFGYLSERFPNTQFIVTAHSPLVVQSAPDDVNIVVLRREGDHVVIDQNVESVKNWRIDQIYASDLFKTTARAPEIDEAMKERTMLLQKKELNKDEEKRLKELNGIAHSLPTAENELDIKAMEIIRKAAQHIQDKK